jgi:cell wall-associated NlpC family hydrolase
MRRSYAVPISLALFLTLPMLSPASASADPTPLIPGPAVPAPALPGTSLPPLAGPSVAAPPAAGPSVATPSVQGPALVGYQQSTNYVIQRALSQRGVPFLYGGGNAAGPTRGTGLKANIVGFDASGLIQYAFAGAGIKMPRTSGEQCNVGRKVPPAQARPGDLLCYGPAGTQSVAMYLGNGQMIEATEPAVTVSPARTSGMVPYLTRIIES